jgi:Protein of unknown function (DUF3102)
MSVGKSAAELVKLAREINRLHNEITEAAQTSLQRSIEIGDMLKDAKKNVAHGEWEGWLAKNCPDISDRTARLYMRFAKKENVAKLEKAAEENGNGVADLSVRGAAKLLAQPRKSDAPKRPNIKLASAAGQSPHLKDLLKNVGADELVEALKQAAWEAEQIRKLIFLLSPRRDQPIERPTIPLRPVVAGQQPTA